MIPAAHLPLQDTIDVKVARLEAHFAHGRESLNELKTNVSTLTTMVMEIRDLLNQNAVVRAETNAEVKAIRRDLINHMREEEGELVGIKDEIHRLINSMATIQVTCPVHDVRIKTLEGKHNV